MVNYERKPLHCVDGVCTQIEGRCFFCGVTGSQPCRFPKYASAIERQIERGVLRHTLTDDGTSVKVTTHPREG